MIMDGEAVCVVARYDSLVAMLSFFFIAGLTTWVEDLDTLEAVLKVLIPVILSEVEGQC